MLSYAPIMVGVVPPRVRPPGSAERGRARVIRPRRRPDIPVAAAGLTLVSIALVLLALGGIAAAGDPYAFDLWMLAVGLYVLAGAILYLGPSSVRNRAAPRTTPAGASLAEAPALSDAPPIAASPTAPAVPDLPDLPDLPTPSPFAPSNTIAGQYAEVARAVASRRSLTRRSNPNRSPEDESIASGYSYATNDRGEAIAASGNGTIDEPIAPEPSSPLEQELERLRYRVAELEGRVPPAEIYDLPDVSAFSGELPGAGPSVCVECGTVLVGGPGETRCPRCQRPMCGPCSLKVEIGPRAHMCADCRRALEAAAMAGEPEPTSPARLGGRTAGMT
ncbi:MAG: hypothetical protein L3J93_05720 [Thermoplasmata archaeon]|nr:hypothetical protein [Thermoplasmata archaeon]